ncbi:MAG: Asp-tRNA(Asn)/Glu-tRNA(Gln) amidotransferase subunit GatB [Candidatus Andersenbacteria bacterium]
MKLEPVIGLEIHVQLKTQSKMFCGCANVVSDAPPNSAICPICLGYPGTLPVPNATAITWVQRAGAALKCELAQHSKFDRKHYFYPDLPKGYQISQYDQPFCGPGQLEIIVEKEARVIGITRIHLEEDAAKNIHDSATNSTLIDFNRAGTPLMEIVTEPDVRTPEEAKVFLQELQRIMRALGVSDADMEKGQLRCDANVSLHEVGSEELYPKTEIKNLNSFRNVERALHYEIKRQQELWEQGKPPAELSTRGFDADQGVTTAQRTKEEAADYRYFPDPDIPPFIFTAEELTALQRQLPELPQDVRARLQRQYGLPQQQATLLVDVPKSTDFFEATASELEQLERDTDGISKSALPELTHLAANMIIRNIRNLWAQLAPDETFAVTAENFAELVALVYQNKVNKSAVEQILEEMQRTGGDPDPIIAKLGLEQVSDSGELEQLVEQVIAENPDVVAKIKEGKTSAAQFLMGQVMAKSKGKANPQVVTKLLLEKIGNG